MLSDVSAFIRRYEMIRPGDRVICALSGGADSVALFWTLYLLQEKLEFQLCAAHFNHGLRGEESDADQAFVQELCHRYGVKLFVQKGNVVASDKGLEAAARDARYAFFGTLEGKIATAHTADDNAETVLMHMVRGTGLKGLGGISPIRQNLIRPMLSVTRQQVLAFLEEYHLRYREDSSNREDTFLRNRLRHHVVPLLRQENPRLSEKLSQMALSLREDEAVLAGLMDGQLPDVMALRQMPRGLRARWLCRFLEESGVKEPQSRHVLLAESLVFAERPSASAVFPQGVVITRRYDRLEKRQNSQRLCAQSLPCPGCVELPELGVRIRCEKAALPSFTVNGFTVCPEGEITVRSRQSGDSIRLQGGTKSLKAVFIDRKIPADRRGSVPVLADSRGVLGVWGIGANLDRISHSEKAVQITFEAL